MWKEQRKERWKEEMANKQIPLLDFYSSLSSPYPIYHPPYYTTPPTMTDPPRTSSRPRQKSQRAREHEDTKRYLKQQLDSPAKIPRPRPKGKPKHRSYCICKQDTPGPMIECDVCSDWYVVLFYIPLLQVDSTLTRRQGSILNVSISQRTMQRKYVRSTGSHLR